LTISVSRTAGLIGQSVAATAPGRCAAVGSVSVGTGSNNPAVVVDKLIFETIFVLPEHTAVDRLMVLRSQHRIVVRVHICRGNPARDPGELIAGSTQQDALSSLGRKKCLDAIEQIVGVNRRQMSRVNDPASDQNPRVKSTQLGHVANQSTFGLPTPNRCRSDPGQSKRVGESIGVLIH